MFNKVGLSILALFVSAVGCGGLVDESVDREHRIGTVTQATHFWGGYHWARTANPFTVKLGDNLAAKWDPFLATTSSDWNVSAVLETVIVPGTSVAKTCKPRAGRVEVCNSRYGNNGWLGIASIWASGLHITQGTVKMNDTYFDRAAYNTPAWRNLVMCQEVGHTFGLDHQDEDFGNPPLGTCMDYTSDPTPNQHPNQHDYDMLDELYAHLDATNTSFATPADNAADIDHDDPSSWGQEIRRSGDGRAALYKKDKQGVQVFTHVFWAEPHDHH